MITKIWITIYFVLFVGCSSDNTNQTKENVVAELSVMSFNVLYSTSVASTYTTIASTNADIVGLQEADEKRIKTIADSLGYYYHSFNKTSGNLSNDDTGIVSRYEITKTFDDGVLVKLNKNLSVAVFSVHLSPYPYEPYDLRDNKISTPEEAVASAKKTRIPEITPVLNTIDNLINQGVPVFLTGDFNEPSHLDWTKNAANNGMHFNSAIEWPCSKAVLGLHMKDSYRTHFPDEVNKPGVTWTTNKSENEVYDRIDFVYHYLQDALELEESMRVGRPNHEVNQQVHGYESDHFAVLSIYKIK